MFDQELFTEQTAAKKTRGGDVAGGAGSWGLHVAAILFLVYSGYHGISASVAYRAAAGLGQLAGIVGIVVIELVMFSIYLAWHNGRIVGARQMIAAGATYAIGFILACLGIVADSQINAGIELSPWLSVYLAWGLPIAPAVMALGAVLIHELSPAQDRARRETEDRDTVAEARFTAYLDGQRAELDAARAVQAMQLSARKQAARQIAAWYSSDQAQRAITATALQDAPRLLRAIGVNVDHAPAAAVGAAGGEGGAAAGPAAVDLGALNLAELARALEALRAAEAAPAPVAYSNGAAHGVAGGGGFFRGGQGD